MRNTVRSLLGLLVLLLLGTGAYYTLNNPITFGRSPQVSPTPESTLGDRPASSPQNASVIAESSDIHKLTQQLAVERRANEPLRKKIKELISEDILAQNRAESQASQLASLRKQLQQVRTNLAAQRDAGTKEREAREAESQNVRMTQEKLEQSQSALNQLEAQLPQLKQQLNEAEKSIRILTQQADTQNQAISEIKKAKGALAKTVTERQATITELNKQLAERPTK